MVQRCFRVFIFSFAFSRCGRTPTCDRRTDRQTEDRQTKEYSVCTVPISTSKQSGRPKRKPRTQTSKVNSVSLRRRIGTWSENPVIIASMKTNWHTSAQKRTTPTYAWYRAYDLKPNSITLAASELVRSWFGAGSKPNSITLSESNQLRTSFEPAPNRLRTR